ncbi:MAG: hypothetical protein DRH04_08850 [Deltaproteobacteria bacterium]|nr:MAG: hypothetical protein DRH04_08850 [Deltaproteobacteria bacterium]
MKRIGARYFVTLNCICSCFPGEVAGKIVPSVCFSTSQKVEKSKHDNDGAKNRELVANYLPGGLHLRVSN